MKNKFKKQRFMEVSKMKIKYENKAVAKFEKLGWGTVFKMSDNYYMKTDSVDGNGVELDVNAVSLTCGALAYFPLDTDVEVIDAVLTIRDKSSE